MASIVLDRITLERGGAEILHDMSLRVDHAELMSIVGPSGSGKSSVLRAIAGLDRLEHGEILFDGVSVTQRSPAERDVAMVFQDDALYPFMTVRRNVSFPLKMRRVPDDEIEDRVTAETRMLAIDRFLERFPGTLAAGHQQLVQAARALVRNPAVFLLDEPLARMDAESRQTVRSEIALLQRGYGVTMVYATNDQEQAMALGDRLAVLDDGRIRQIGPPGDVYSRPDDTFVAGFVGSPDELGVLIEGSPLGTIVGFDSDDSTLQTACDTSGRRGSCRWHRYPQCRQLRPPWKYCLAQPFR